MTALERLSALEKQAHTLTHRLDALEKERLPSRTTTIETNLAHLSVNMSKLEKHVERIEQITEDGNQKNQQFHDQQRGFLKAVSWAGAGLLTIFQIIPYFLKAAS